MKSLIPTLSQELKELQTINIDLYEKLATLKKEKSELQQPKDDPNDSENEFKSQIEELIAKQKEEESRKSAAQKNLHSLIDEIRRVQNEIDEQNSFIQNSLKPIITAEEEMTNHFCKEVIEKCKKKPHASITSILKIQNLLSKLNEKSKEYIESQNEIEKYSRLIVFNENPIPDSSKIDNYLENDFIQLSNFNRNKNKRKKFQKSTV